VTRTITNVAPNLGTDWFDGNPVVYCIQQGAWNNTIPYRRDYSYLIKWDLDKVTGNDWMTGVVWNVSTVQPDGSGPGQGGRGSGLYVYGDYGVMLSTGESKFYGVNLTNGEFTWIKDVGYPSMKSYGYIYDQSNGIFFGFDSAGMAINAYDMKTGDDLWTAPVGEYPWGSQISIRCTAYDRIYVGSFDGHLRCLNGLTGQQEWEYYIGDTTETIFNTWAFYKGTAAADGKYYISTSEHTPSNPSIRGNKLFCFDAFTGDLLWNMTGAFDTNIAEGYLVGACENDGYMYCFGKGKTETTVMAGPKVTAKGSSVVIEGTVMDMSPAQPGTPAISDEDMGAWMNYKHMQTLEPKTSPFDDHWGTSVCPTGVPVKLIVVHPDGNVEWIYTRTTDMYGHFEHMYIPPTEGTYKILACFDGSESYWPSVAETAIAVQPGSSPAQQFGWQELTETSFTITEIAIITAVAVAIVIGVVSYWMLRKRQ
jgi:outer membrane protein assembly factor BamB